MSHSTGIVYFKSDNSAFLFEYNGTSGICLPKLHPTKASLFKTWRHKEWDECQCGNDEEVVIESHYGPGFHWEGKACRHCRVITKGHNAEDIFTREGLYRTGTYELFKE